MIRGLKVLLLAAMTALAIGAVAVPAAQAVPTFHSELEETTISSTPDGTGKTTHHVLDFAGLTLTCAKASFHGTQKGKTAAELTLEAEFEECLFAGTVPIPFSMNGCDFVVHASGVVDIASRAGKNCTTEPITIFWQFPATSCEVKIGPQTGLKELTFHNIKPGANEEITVETHLSGIKYTSIEKGPMVGGCPKLGTFEDGTYTTGNSILTGASTSEPTKMTNIKWE